jgi:uncharacterized membrane protein
MPSKEQGRDAIVIEAPIERIWTLIHDSRELARWGPPVRGVTVLDAQPGRETLGSRRRIEAEMEGRRGTFVERRDLHVEGRAIGYVIEEESFGLFRIMSAPGFSLELAAEGAARTRVIFTFFHDPRGIMGHVMNTFVVLRAQRRNRLAALDALKAYAERGQEPRR